MLYAVSALLAALICAPILGGHLLFRDAVSVPRFPLNPAAFGIDGSAPRAVPQDAVLGVASRAVDGGWLVAGLTALAVFGAGVGYGRLARRLVPRAGTAGAVAAAVLAIWNPFVAERLLQGQWSLLLGYAALGPIVLAVVDLGERWSWRDAAAPACWFAVAGFTPTGSVLALIVAAATAIAVRPGLRTSVVGAVGWAATASPWLVVAAVSEAAGSSGGASAFAVRAEPGLGSFGTVLGLGGVWNADAVPDSRTWWWAAVATGLLLFVIVGGSIVAARSGLFGSPAVRALAVLAAVTVVAVAAAATGPGLTVMDALLANVPGAGLLRDTQKYLALAVPFAAIAAAAAVAGLRRLVPGGFAAAAVALVIVAPLPDLAWGLGGRVRPVTVPDDYTRAAAVIDDGAGSSVAVWPTDTVRHLSWTDGPSLSPLPRMLDAPVVVDPTLIVDGETVDAPTGRTADIVAALESGGDPTVLAALGVGWVVVEEAQAPPMLAADVAPVFVGEHLAVFRLDGAVPAPTPGAATWAAAIVALCLWFGALLAGLASLRRRRGRTAG